MSYNTPIAAASVTGLATVATTGVYNDLTSKPTLGTAAAQNTGAFATAAQGTTANSALQPAGNGSSLTGITASQVSGLSTVIQNYLGYTTYSTLLTQSGTSAPAASPVVNGFSPVTFTWARTTAGIYTITANSAIFTANKTAVIIGTPLSSLNTLNAVITSTTVITLTAALSSVIATVLTAVATDALLTNTLFEIRVYN